MKIATWHVNGIRARQAQVQDWIARECPDVVCLQELKATSDQVPAALCEMEGYWCAWHGGKAYSGVGLHISRDRCPERPAFEHPDFDYEYRIVTARIGDLTVASVYVPNGGKDFPAKMRFLEVLDLGVLDVESRVCQCGGRGGICQPWCNRGARLFRASIQDVLGHDEIPAGHELPGLAVGLTPLSAFFAATRIEGIALEAPCGCGTRVM